MENRGNGTETKIDEKGKKNRERESDGEEETIGERIRTRR